MRLQIVRVLALSCLVGPANALVGLSSTGLSPTATTGRPHRRWERGLRQPESKYQSQRPSYIHSFAFDSRISLAVSQKPEEDPIDSSNPPPLLTRLTDQVVDGLTTSQPWGVGQLPGAILLALAVLPLVTSLTQTVVTLVLFTGLALLGRGVGGDGMADDEDDDEEDTTLTDVIALLSAGAAGFLLLPGNTGPPLASLTTKVQDGSPSLAWSLLVGWGGLAVIGAVLGQTQGGGVLPEINNNNKTDNSNDGGPNRELLNLWDDEFSGRK